jgi:hypothetical protein
MVFAAARRFPVLSGLALAALLLAGASYSTPLPSRAHANAPTNRIWLATNGSDKGCARNSPNRPCATFDRAFDVAHPGDTVIVAPGKYPETDARGGATGIHGAKAQPVIFACAGPGEVTFAAPIFAFYPGAAGIIMRGDCFHFHIPTFGAGGYPTRTHDVVLDGVHMDSFECLGCANVTIRRSEIGPITACSGRGDLDAHSQCDPANPIEAFYATQRDGTRGVQAEPFIHNGSAGLAEHFSLIGNRIHHIQTKNSGVLHTGGLLVWNTNGLVMRGNTFDHDAIYDVEFNAGSNDTNVTVEDNIFQPPVIPLDGGANDGKVTETAFREFTAGSPGATFKNWSIRYNRFAHGLTIDGQGGQRFENVRVVGNVLGTASLCARGVQTDSNVFVGRETCGTNAFRVGSFPYINYQNGDYRLKPKSTVACFMANVRAGRPPGQRGCRR